MAHDTTYVILLSSNINGWNHEGFQNEDAERELLKENQGNDMVV